MKIRHAMIRFPEAAILRIEEFSTTPLACHKAEDRGTCHQSVSADDARGEKGWEYRQERPSGSRGLQKKQEPEAR